MPDWTGASEEADSHLCELLSSADTLSTRISAEAPPRHLAHPDRAASGLVRRKIAKRAGEMGADGVCGGPATKGAHAGRRGRRGSEQVWGSDMLGLERPEMRARGWEGRQQCETFGTSVMGAFQ